MDRNALAAALYIVDRLIYEPDQPIIAAARERLAQLPEPCPTTHYGIYINECPDCYNTGRVYPAETVERIAQVLRNICDLEDGDIEAVLDALNGGVSE